MNVARILARWDAIAWQQLAERAAQLDEENAQLRSDAYWADRAAESWQETAFQLMEDAGARPGITQDGQIVALSAGQ